jgi:lysophospholipid acyltransferase (LPLAT)-like uncharacterized protein
MKLRHPWLTHALAWSGAWWLRGWTHTLRYQYAALGPDLDPFQLAPECRYLYAFWHEHLLLPARYFRGVDCTVLISLHADGDLIANVIRRLGFRAVRGSPSRGGVEAVRRILHGEVPRHLVITPDGPRGPRRHVQLGVAYLASRLGLPIVPTGFGCDRPWRCGSWDRMVIPRPFRRACCVMAPPVVVPPAAGRGELERYRQSVETALNDVTEQAERWAERCIPPQLPATGARYALQRAA